MSDSENRTPETEPEDEALDDVEALGGDAEIMESLPDEGSPVTTETDYDALDESDVFDDGEVHSYPQPGEEDSAEAHFVDDVGVDFSGPYPDFVDIDAALASVAALGEAARPPEWPEESPESEIVSETEVMPPVEAPPAPPLVPARAPRSIQAPPPFTPRRGQMASVVPALALILVGAWLTFATTAPDAVPANPLVIAVVLGAAVVLTMLAQWLSSGRWSRGVFFFAILALLVAGSVYYQTTEPDVNLLGPLILGAVGLAFGLTGLLARPADRRLLLPGLIFVAAGVVALAVALGVVPSALVAGAAPYWPVLVAVLAVLWLLPVVAKRRR